MANLDSQAAPLHPASAPMHERDGADASTPRVAPSRSGRMSANPDRFDRLLGLVPPAAPVPSSPTPRRALVPLSAFEERKREPVIHSTRPARFVDHAVCPMCGTDRMGIEYHGELKSGAKVHQIAAHTPNFRRVERGQPRCLGAGMRMVFEGGAWKGAPAL